MAYFNTSIDDLPELDADSRKHAEQVRLFLVDLIEADNGFIGFDRFMETVLYAPGLGYYSAGSEKFGPSGDYVTAPLLSPLFSQTLARFISGQMRMNDVILELGAGTGVMAAEMLSWLNTTGSEPTTYNILETAADLRQRQMATLSTLTPEVAGRVCWLEQLSSDKGFNGVIVANEVIDAMPVKRFALISGQVLELGVGVCDGQLCWKTVVADSVFEQTVLSRLPSPIEHYPEGYHSEIRPTVSAWLKTLGEYMGSGLIVLLDYGHERSGYFETSRANGTLRGYYRHFMLEDPFVFPGMVDLTASVDFTEVAEAAVDNGFLVAGYTSQANFLIDNGLLERAADESIESGVNRDQTRLSRAEAIKCLTDPGEMGESIKVMVLSKDRDIDTGFSRDQRYRL